ncbi:zinc ribbon domain-containing protein [Enterococcus saccharolyticus]|nr:zinc ribbon domain-containing protein [Enterococcus saccharolyticus]
MMKKCPHCDAEIAANQTVCPNCGKDLSETSQAETPTSDHKNNEHIKWSDYQDVPLGSVMEHFSDLHEKNNDGKTDFEENSILADYIKEHKEPTSVQEKSEANEQEIDESVKASDVVNEPEPEQVNEPVVTPSVAEDNSEAEKTEEPVEPVGVVTKEPESNSAKSENLAPQTPKKRNKKIYWLTAAAIVVLAGGGWIYYDHQQKEEAARQEQLRIENALSTIDKEMDTYFLDADQQFIAPGKTSEGITKLMEELEEYSKEDAYDKLVVKGQKIQVKLAVLDQINSHFTEPIVVGDKLQENAHIKEGETVEMASLTEKNAFSDLINQAIKKGKDEAKQLQAASKAVQSLTAHYKDNQLSDAVSRKDYESTKQEVEKIFDGKEKETLLADLEPIDKALVAKEKAQAEAEKQAAIEAEKQAEQQRQAAQPQQPNSGGQAGTSAPSSNEGQEILNDHTPRNKNNQPIISPRQSDIDDVNNPAWEWAPGVYDKVINEAIKRGYIVEGGFKLERVRIENGEGYYNLYATNTKSSLMQGIGESALPMYLFTINDKTGFFRGNGSD